MCPHLFVSACVSVCVCVCVCPSVHPFTWPSASGESRGALPVISESGRVSLSARRVLAFIVSFSSRGSVSYLFASCGWAIILFITVIRT